MPSGVSHSSRQLHKRLGLFEILENSMSRVCQVYGQGYDPVYAKFAAGVAIVTGIVAMVVGAFVSPLFEVVCWIWFTILVVITLLGALNSQETVQKRLLWGIFCFYFVLALVAALGGMPFLTEGQSVAMLMVGISAFLGVLQIVSS